METGLVGKLPMSTSDGSAPFFGSIALSVYFDCCNAIVSCKASVACFVNRSSRYFSNTTCSSRFNVGCSVLIIGSTTGTTGIVSAVAVLVVVVRSSSGLSNGGGATTAIL